MKKITFLIAAYLLAATLTVQSQSNSDYRGIWYYASASGDPDDLETDIKNVIDPLHNNVTLKGVLISIPWWKFQKSTPPQFPCDDPPCDHHLDGSYDWDTKFDAYLHAIWEANPNLYIGLMIFTGPDAPIDETDGDLCSNIPDGANTRPNWLSSSIASGGAGVNTFVTDKGETDFYPDYLGKGSGQMINGKSRYELYWGQMLRDVFYHIKEDVKDYDSETSDPYWDISKLLFLQSCEGKSGDAEPYKGEPCPAFSDYAITDQAWQTKQKQWWKATYDQIEYLNSTVPALQNLHFMVNTGVTDKLYGIKSGTTRYVSLESDCIDVNPNPFPKTSSLFGYATVNLPKAWRKATNMGHWYQQNFETKFKEAFDNLKSLYPNVLIRDELDFPGSDVAITDPAILYAIAASALHSGLDMWMIDFKELFTFLGGTTIRPEIKEGLEFFNRHVNSYKAPGSTTGFCYLREGLDASLSRYNNTDCPAPANLEKGYVVDCPANPGCNTIGMTRTECIVTHSGRQGRGAWNPAVSNCNKDDDPAFDGRWVAQGGPFNQFNNSSKYDVGWYTFPDEYQINLILQPSDYSRSWWNQQTNLSTQGRFARDVGSITTSNKNRMNFIVKNVSFSPGTCIKVVVNFYNPPNSPDCNWRWNLKTSQGNNEILFASKSSKPNHNEWDKADVIVPASALSAFDVTDNIPDFYIENVSPDNTDCGNDFRIMFSTIEFYQEPCN